MTGAVWQECEGGCGRLPVCEDCYYCENCCNCNPPDVDEVAAHRDRETEQIPDWDTCEGGELIYA